MEKQKTFYYSLLDYDGEVDEILSDLESERFEILSYEVEPFSVGLWVTVQYTTF